ncbi:hypothetical protein J2T12_002886 [Paenibacillus anaericanus]|nr:hypothetical protein [Paenibacillus anaericanus]
MSSVLSKVYLLVLSCLLMAGCTLRGGGGVPREESKFKVMFWTEESFAQNYGDLF